MTFRVGAFAVVAALGFVLQLTLLAVLVRSGWPYLLATAVAVEAAVLHNYIWHGRWTWRDRGASPSPLGRLLRYHASTGLTSVGGNVLITAALVQGMGLPPLAANAAAVAMMGLANFRLADRWVFTRKAGCTAALLLLAGTPSLHAADLTPDTLAAWTRYVQRFEAVHESEGGQPARGPQPPTGDTIGVPGGTIHVWRGAVLVTGITVEQLLDRLLHPGTPPPQDDVVEARVLEHRGDALRIYLKLIRTTIITVIYDTDHEVAFTRLGPGRATSRSVATSIREADGGDRGFLWRLNSYWRYTQVGPDVLVELQSLSLSRSVPVLLRPVASPIINRVARESMSRTLDAVARGFSRGQRLGTGATRTPTASSPRRSAAASAALPGVSP